MNNQKKMIKVTSKNKKRVATTIKKPKELRKWQKEKQETGEKAEREAKEMKEI